MVTIETTTKENQEAVTLLKWDWIVMKPVWYLFVICFVSLFELDGSHRSIAFLPFWSFPPMSNWLIQLGVGWTKKANALCTVRVRELTTSTGTAVVFISWSLLAFISRLMAINYAVAVEVTHWQKCTEKIKLERRCLSFLEVVSIKSTQVFEISKL